MIPSPPTPVLAVALGLVVAGAAACGGGGRLVVPVALEETASAAPRYPGDFGSHEAVVRGVAAILARDLDLPVPERVTLYIYRSREVFERGLVNDGQLPRVRAAELGEFAVGVGKRRQLLLHDPGGLPASSDWLRLVAHELTHVAQIELAAGEGRAEQWLAEGMAEWVAFAVLERLGLDALAARRAAALGHVRDYPPLRDRHLDLEELGTPRGFTARHLREGALQTYQLSFLIADYLIRRNGFARLPAYFRNLATGHGRRESFRLAFGQSLVQFEEEILDHLGRVTH